MQPKDIDRVAVVGAGLMGHGIALQFALGADAMCGSTT